MDNNVLSYCKHELSMALTASFIPIDKLLHHLKPFFVVIGDDVYITFAQILLF